MSFGMTALLFLILLASAAIGWVAQHVLSPRHVTRDSIDSIRLIMGMLLTFSALVLGLLTSSAKQRFDDYNIQISAFATDLIELDHRLVVYGHDVDDIRRNLRRYVAAAIADTWPAEKPPPGEYPRFAHSSGPRSVEVTELGDMLSDVDVAIEHLAPSDDFHQQIAARLRDRAASVISQRWQLIFSAQSTISWPFLLVLTSWLSIVFATFGLTSPRNPMVYAVLMLSALSIASPLYLILDYSRSRNGSLELSSTSMRAALAHIDRTP